MERESARPVIEPFDKKRHDRKNFSCEVESLQRYFRTQASQDARSKAAAIFVLAEGANVLGFYTLSSYTLEPGELPSDLVKRLPSYPKLPAILIGRLARDEKCRGKGIGEILLVDALRRSLESTARVGAIAVVVDAGNEKACNFYLGVGFIQFPDHANRLFMLMSTIKETFLTTEK